MITQRREIHRTQAYDIHILGAPRAGLRDLYHALLRLPWWAALATIVGGYLLLNTLFAAIYIAVGGIANSAAGSYGDAFFFSVQTMGTIGYGTMYPLSRAANLVMVAESVTGLVVTALATGLVFVRFSQTRPRLVFSTQAAIAPMDGVPTLVVRVGNERRNQIVNTLFRLTLMMTTRTAEGVTVYRAQELPLVRERAHALSRAWMISHRIVPGTPLYDETPDSLREADAELIAEVVGTDDTSLQPVHAIYTWYSSTITWGARLADIVSETADGNVQVDLGRFHEVVSTRPTESFPYGIDQ
jgi:inward rectifier potassium channel